MLLLIQLLAVRCYRDRTYRVCVVDTSAANASRSDCQQWIEQICLVIARRDLLFGKLTVIFRSRMHDQKFLVLGREQVLLLNDLGWGQILPLEVVFSR